jgi:hypothetical protein
MDDGWPPVRFHRTLSSKGVYANVVARTESILATKAGRLTLNPIESAGVRWAIISRLPLTQENKHLPRFSALTLKKHVPRLVLLNPSKILNESDYGTNLDSERPNGRAHSVGRLRGYANRQIHTIFQRCRR